MTKNKRGLDIRFYDLDKTGTVVNQITVDGVGFINIHRDKTFTISLTSQVLNKNMTGDDIALLQFALKKAQNIIDNHPSRFGGKDKTK